MGYVRQVRRFEASGRSGRSTGATYEARLAAIAANIPVRRLLGWCEAHVFQPTIPARGKGSRRRFTRGDIVALVLIAELQRLFGPNLRPGLIARDIAEHIDDYRAGGF